MILTRASFRNTIPYYRNSTEKVISEKGSTGISCLNAMSSICTARASLDKGEIVIKFKGKINHTIQAFINENQIQIFQPII